MSSFFYSGMGLGSRIVINSPLLFTPTTEKIQKVNDNLTAYNQFQSRHKKLLIIQLTGLWITRAKMPKSRSTISDAKTNIPQPVKSYLGKNGWLLKG